MGASPGIVFLRRSADTAAFLDAWERALKGNASASEQDALSAVVRRAPLKPPMVHPDNPHVFLAAGQKLPFGVLPVAGFLNGHTYSVQRLHEVPKTLFPKPLEPSHSKPFQLLDTPPPDHRCLTAGIQPLTKAAKRHRPYTGGDLPPTRPG